MSEPTHCTLSDPRRWLEYWLNELGEVPSAALEEHLFECASCTAVLERLAALGHSIRRLYKDGAIATVVPTAFVRRMKDAGMSVREYHLAPQDSVNCTVTAQDDFVAGHLAAPLAGVTRLDAVLERVDVNWVQRLTDVPFNAADGEVTLLPAMREIRPLEKQTLRVHVIAVDAAGERTLGTYTFNHRRSRG